jgi:hypothetical protein
MAESKYPFEKITNCLVYFQMVVSLYPYKYSTKPNILP